VTPPAAAPEKNIKAVIVPATAARAAGAAAAEGAGAEAGDSSTTAPTTAASAANPAPAAAAAAADGYELGVVAIMVGTYPKAHAQMLAKVPKMSSKYSKGTCSNAGESAQNAAKVPKMTRFSMAP
jgi:hypothetical protein